MNQTGSADSYLGEVFRLEGRSAVVVGGTSGLGEAGAVALARCGAKVTVAGRDAQRAAAVVEEIEKLGGDAVPDEIDVCDEASVAALADRCEERYGSVDVLLNAAGVITPRPSIEVSLDEWRQQIDTNLTGTFLACREFGKRMIEHGKGSIINFGSTDSFIGVPQEVAYCSSKGGVAQITRTLGAEWIQHGVRVNAVGPSDFVTPMAEPFMDDQEFIDWQKEVVPIGRLGQPSELLGAIIFLASEAGSMMVGHTIMVDGGRTAI